MPAVYVTQQELRTNLGIGTLYSDSTVEEVCQTAEDLIKQYEKINDIEKIMNYYKQVYQLTKNRKGNKSNS